MKTLPVLAFVALSCVWGFSYALTNVAVREIHPFPLVTVRTFFGVLFLGLVALKTRPVLPERRLDWLALTVPGILGTAVPLLLIAWGQQYVDSSLAAILVTSTPIFTMVFAHLLLRDERITWLRTLGVVVGFAGVVLLMGRNMGGAPRGTLLATASLVLVAMCYASSSVFARRYTTQHPPVVQALVGQVTAVVLVGGMAPFTEGALRLPMLMQTWAALLALGVLSTGVGYLLFFFLLGSIGPTRTQMINYPIMFNGVLLGVLMLGEVVVWQMAAGAVLILGGLGIVNWPVRRAPRLPDNAHAPGRP